MATTPRRTIAPPVPTGNTGADAPQAIKAHGQPSLPPQTLSDYVIPRQEAAYILGYQRGLEDGAKLAKDSASTRAARQPKQPSRYDVAQDRAQAWMVMTGAVVVCVMFTLITLRYMVGRLF